MPCVLTACPSEESNLTNHTHLSGCWGEPVLLCGGHPAHFDPRSQQEIPLGDRVIAVDGRKVIGDHGDHRVIACVPGCVPGFGPACVQGYEHGCGPGCGPVCVPVCDPGRVIDCAPGRVPGWGPVCVSGSVPVCGPSCTQAVDLFIVKGRNEVHDALNCFGVGSVHYHSPSIYYHTAHDAPCVHTACPSEESNLTNRTHLSGHWGEPSDRQATHLTVRDPRIELGVVNRLPIGNRIATHPLEAGGSLIQPISRHLQHVRHTAPTLLLSTTTQHTMRHA